MRALILSVQAMVIVLLATCLAQHAAATGIMLEWTFPTEDENLLIEFRVYERHSAEDQFPTSPTQIFTPSERSYDSGQLPDGCYIYIVAAVGAAGDEVRSNEAGICFHDGAISYPLELPSPQIIRLEATE
jgi:hypothetical protein